ncbi:tRNA (adenosine(37)-N6)-threonylcarbamoyltransferase complex ATPase subunit type 1 TsaE [Domibacillus sp. DTU_2020_1001157_1_SI_ALB_TIR_016]|uniref:tRNA (adenosine(37)-N6)-threonylcarbamoyltransferase complex ATPase subunit type 1 TsaE n=1 Tax=Domibacillus sp. DTU_2020_1001157_1_SI_ALB_TIR_016 TaxID=3077789 RepID=UPI0028EB89DD|nr:tRNA (adenosine(37)-N6)-threonylcarbamoyltransferase complex ATPase subunit type 1 TsaE [Domibacillus sp. DTU_2020_1001157_1_SI_ALB_TIR_016]WNS80389.1 tRNA (adenosine(37)-N6)-threonylcarbamoyltransferase complex ATPase subunit type 1 TsaE [Domibacillus sp. DTU_2020_1001157_1_SI_ALB_TIR_016]
MTSSYTWTLNNLEEMSAFASALADTLRPGDVLLLEGDLGAGKTTFTQHLAKALGVTKNVNSPTFTIIKEYEGTYPLYHMDVYRLGEESEDLGFDEYFYGNGITVVEWAHLIADQLPEEYIQINLFHTGVEGQRKVQLTLNGDRYVRILEKVNTFENISD